MLELWKQSTLKQFEAALCMFNDCVRKCPDAHWDAPVAKYPFWQVAYHTLCFVDLYLTKDNDSFAFRDLHPAREKELLDEYPSRRFERQEIERYIQICRDKAAESINAETELTLAGRSGFDWCRFSRAEMHLYNLRHLMHHTGQMGACLRRIDPSLDPMWMGSGWK